MNDYNSGGLTPEQIQAISNAIMIPVLFCIIIATIACWKIYSKAGKPGWSAIVPVYNCVVWLKIIGKPVWWTVFLMLPYVAMFLVMRNPSNILVILLFWLASILTITFSVWMTNLLRKSFGRSLGFTFGMLFLPFVYYPILAWGNYQYVGPAGLKANKATAPAANTNNTL